MEKNALRRKTTAATQALAISNESVAKTLEADRLELTAIKRILDRRRSGKNIKFENGKPATSNGQTKGTETIRLALLTQAGNEAAALQRVYDAVPGRAIFSDDHALAVALNDIVDLDPKTPIEGMLISQMVAVNSTIGVVMRIATNPDQSLDNSAQLLHTATKLHRTFVAQVECLQKLRGTGQQTVRVEHVTVNAGGQAIVGNVANGKGGGGNNGK